MTVTPSRHRAITGTCSPMSSLPVSQGTSASLWWVHLAASTDFLWMHFYFPLYFRKKHPPGKTDYQILGSHFHKYNSVNNYSKLSHKDEKILDTLHEKQWVKEEALFIWQKKTKSVQLKHSDG